MVHTVDDLFDTLIHAFVQEVQTAEFFGAKSHPLWEVPVET